MGRKSDRRTLLRAKKKAVYKIASKTPESRLIKFMRKIQSDELILVDMHSTKISIKYHRKRQKCNHDIHNPSPKLYALFIHLLRKRKAQRHIITIYENSIYAPICIFIRSHYVHLRISMRKSADLTLFVDRVAHYYLYRSNILHFNVLKSRHFDTRYSRKNIHLTRKQLKYIYT